MPTGVTPQVRFPEEVARLATEFLLRREFVQKIVQIAYFETGAVATGTTAVPVDDTIPQNTEGDQYMSIGFTPQRADSILHISSEALISYSADTHHVSMALFRNSIVNALAATSVTIRPAGEFEKLTISHNLNSPGIALTTFKIRIGGQGGTTTFNGEGGARRYGGVANSGIFIMEWLP